MVRVGLAAAGAGCFDAGFIGLPARTARARLAAGHTEQAHNERLASHTPLGCQIAARPPVSSLERFLGQSNSKQSRPMPHQDL